MVQSHAYKPQSEFKNSKMHPYAEQNAASVRKMFGFITGMICRDLRNKNGAGIYEETKLHI
jgi:hypothetical protein